MTGVPWDFLTLLSVPPSILLHSGPDPGTRLTAGISPSASYLEKHPQVTKGACSWLGSSFVGIPSLRRRSVGPRRTDIHVLTALSRHPCRSAHSASSAFGLHPSRVWRCLGFLRTKIKINCRSKASRLKPVLRGYAFADRSHALRGNDQGGLREDQTLRTCGSELAHEGAGTSIGYLACWIKHSRASSHREGGAISKNVGA